MDSAFGANILQALETVIGNLFFRMIFAHLRCLPSIIIFRILIRRLFMVLSVVHSSGWLLFITLLIVLPQIVSFVSPTLIRLISLFSCKRSGAIASHLRIKSFLHRHRLFNLFRRKFLKLDDTANI